MSSGGKYPGNGASLEDCHTNIFALADLNGLKWKRFLYEKSGAPVSRQFHSTFSDPNQNLFQGLGGRNGGIGSDCDVLNDPLLLSYTKCLSSGILCVWRSVPTEDSTQNHSSNHNSYDDVPIGHFHHQGDQMTRVPPFFDRARELWLFWHGDEPDFNNLIHGDVKSREYGTWDDGITYECRTLLFKSFHNIIERYLTRHGFVRLGKWFVEPHAYNQYATNRNHLAFSFSFFLHGESAICTSLDIKQLPAIYKLSNGLLITMTQNLGGKMNVILSPFGLCGRLTGRSFKETDPGVAQMLQGWDMCYPNLYERRSKMDANEGADPSAQPPPSSNLLPKALEITIGGYTMCYPTCHVFLADGDNDVDFNDRIVSRYSVGRSRTGDMASASSSPVPYQAESDGTGVDGLPDVASPYGPVKKASRGDTNYGQLSPPESPLNIVPQPNWKLRDGGSNAHVDQHPISPSPSCEASGDGGPETTHGSDYRLCTMVTYQNYAKSCLDCEVRNIEEKVGKNDGDTASDFAWDFQDPVSYRSCECHRRQILRSAPKPALAHPTTGTISDHPHSLRATSHKILTPHRRGRDRRLRRRSPAPLHHPYGASVSFHQRRRPSVSFLCPPPQPVLRASTGPSPGTAPAQRSQPNEGAGHDLGQEMANLVLPEPVLEFRPSASTTLMMGACGGKADDYFKDLLFRDTVVRIVRDKQVTGKNDSMDSSLNPSFNNEPNGIETAASRDPDNLNFETLYNTDSLSLLKKLSQTRPENFPHTVLPVSAYKITSFGSDLITPTVIENSGQVLHGRQPYNPDSDSRKMMANQGAFQDRLLDSLGPTAAYDESGQSYIPQNNMNGGGRFYGNGKSMFDPYEFNEDFNHPNPKQRQKSGGGVGGTAGSVVPGVTKNATIKTSISAPPPDNSGNSFGSRGSIVQDIKEEPCGTYDQNIFQSLNQYSTSLHQKSVGTNPGIPSPFLPSTYNQTLTEGGGTFKDPSAQANQRDTLKVTEGEDSKKWDLGHHNSVTGKTHNLALNLNTNNTFSSTTPSLNTLLGAPPINPALLTSSDLSRIFPTPPSLENNNLYSPCGSVPLQPQPMDLIMGSAQSLPHPTHIEQCPAPTFQMVAAAIEIDPGDVTRRQQMTHSQLPQPKLNDSLETMLERLIGTASLDGCKYGAGQTYPTPQPPHRWWREPNTGRRLTAPKLDWVFKKRYHHDKTALFRKLEALNRLVDKYYMDMSQCTTTIPPNPSESPPSPNSFLPLSLQPNDSIEDLYLSPHIKYDPPSKSCASSQLHPRSILQLAPKDERSNLTNMPRSTGPISIHENSSTASRSRPTANYHEEGGGGATFRSLLVNLIMSASASPCLNFFPDTNFDASTLCVCNMTIRPPAHIVPGDVLRHRQQSTAILNDGVKSLLPPPPQISLLFQNYDRLSSRTTLANEHLHNCMCGFNASINRVRAFGSGLFYEDEMEIMETSGPGSLFSVFDLNPPAPSSAVIGERRWRSDLRNNAIVGSTKSQQHQATGGGPEHPWPNSIHGDTDTVKAQSNTYLLEYLTTQASPFPAGQYSSGQQIPGYDVPAKLLNARPFYFNARYYLDQCKLSLQALDQLEPTIKTLDPTAAVIKGSVAGGASDDDKKREQSCCWEGWIATLFTMHLWPHYPNTTALSSEDTLVTLRSLRPLIQDAILKKGVRACLFEHAYNISGPLTWQQFHKLAGRGNEERCEPQPLPLLLTGYEHERLTVSPLSINFWEYLHVEPYSFPKDIGYVVVVPDDEAIANLATTFFDNLNAFYEVCRLGRHLPLSRLRDGFLKVGPKTAKKFQDQQAFLGVNGQFTLGGSKLENKLTLYTMALKNQLGPFLATQPLTISIPITPSAIPGSVSQTSTVNDAIASFHTEAAIEHGQTVPQHHQPTSGGNPIQPRPSNAFVNGQYFGAGQAPAHDDHPTAATKLFNYGHNGNYNSTNDTDSTALHHHHQIPNPHHPAVENHQVGPGGATQNGEHYSGHHRGTVISNGTGSNSDTPDGTPASLRYHDSSVHHLATNNNSSQPLSVVVYVVDPFSIFHRRSPDRGRAKEYPDDQGGRQAGHLSRLFTIGLTKCYTDMVSDLGPEIRSKITLKIISLESLVQFSNAPEMHGSGHVTNNVSNYYRSFALSIYSQIRYTVPNDELSKSYTGFGPGVHKNSILQKNEATGYTHLTSPNFFAPPFILAPKSAVLDYGTVLGKKFAAAPEPGTENSKVLFCGYCLSHDQKWLIATCTDDRGECLDSCFISMETSNRFMKKRMALQRIVLRKLWDFVIKTISTTNSMWRIVLGRFGRIGHGELKVWSSILSKKNLQRCNSDLRDSCRACSILRLPSASSSSSPPPPPPSCLNHPGVALLSACLVSLDLNTTLNVMANSVAPELDRMGYSKLCPLTTPKDVSSTHILVFPLSATAQPTVKYGKEEDSAIEDLVGVGRDRSNQLSTHHQHSAVNHYAREGGRDDVMSGGRDDLLNVSSRDLGSAQGCLGGEGDDDDDDLLLLNAFSDLPIDQFLIDVDDVMMMDVDHGLTAVDESNSSHTEHHSINNNNNSLNRNAASHPHPQGGSTYNPLTGQSRNNPPQHAQHQRNNNGGLLNSNHNLLGQLSHMSSEQGIGGGSGFGAERRKRISGLDFPDEPIMLLQQPLALGYYVSTAKIGPMPYWFYSNHSGSTMMNPSFLNAALHINCASVLHTSDDLFTHNLKNSQKSHALDSDQTTDILRYVLEGYNRLSWLVMDPCTRDRISCLPIHLQILMNIYHMLATYS